MKITAKSENIFVCGTARAAKLLFLLIGPSPAQRTKRCRTRFSSPFHPPPQNLPHNWSRFAALERKKTAVELMEEIPQVKTNREALKHILLMLVGMAEMGFGRPLSLVLGEAAVAPRPGRAGRTGSKKPSPALCLPRHLYHAILLLLRPAESAARRLIIATAQGIVVTLPPLRPRKPKPKISDTVAAMRRLGLAVNLSQENFAR